MKNDANKMTLDFTDAKYEELYSAIVQSGYAVVSVKDYLSLQPREKVVILRHDVDRKPENALKMAEIERGFDLRATYYFRSTKDVFKACIMHEIGYHYEVLDKAQGNFDIIVLVSLIYIYIPDIRLVDAYTNLRRAFYELQERDEERELEETEILG